MVRYGSITLYRKFEYQRMIAIIIPIIVPKLNDIIVSYIVVQILLNKLLSLYKVIIVFTTLLGDDVIKVFIILKSASNCHVIMIVAKMAICISKISIFFLFFFFKYCLCSLLYMNINILPYIIIVKSKFFLISVVSWG